MLLRATGSGPEVVQAPAKDRREPSDLLQPGVFPVGLDQGVAFALGKDVLEPIQCTIDLPGTVAAALGRKDGAAHHVAGDNRIVVTVAVERGAGTGEEDIDLFGVVTELFFPHALKWAGGRLCLFLTQISFLDLGSAYRLTGIVFLLMVRGPFTGPHLPVSTHPRESRAALRTRARRESAKW